MKIAISTEGGNVSAHFGRCPSYTIADVENGKVVRVEEIPNPGHEPGFLPRFLAQKGVSVVIAGGMGPRAQALFAQNSIKTVTGIQGEVRSILARYVSGQLQAGQDLCEHPQETCLDEPAGQEKAMAAGTRLCVTAQGPTLQDKIDQRFGRAAYFLFIDPETGAVEPVKNTNVEVAHGAGIQSAQLVANKNTGLLITGQVGPKARQVLDGAGIQIYTQEEGTVEEALTKIVSSGHYSK